MTEWQKRGLPHVHILVIMVSSSVPKTAGEIDRVICAEIPDYNTNPKLHDLVKNKMIHGPCSGFNPHSPCLMNREKKCEKEYPKKTQEFTTCSEDGFTTYRRRSTEQGGNIIEKTVLK